VEDVDLDGRTRNTEELRQRTSEGGPPREDIWWPGDVGGSSIIGWVKYPRRMSVCLRPSDT
jgi:hypothetical protein